MIFNTGLIHLGSEASITFISFIVYTFIVLDMDDLDAHLRVDAWHMSLLSGSIKERLTLDVCRLSHNHVVSLRYLSLKSHQTVKINLKMIFT